MPNTVNDALSKGVVPQPHTLVDTSGNPYNALSAAFPMLQGAGAATGTSWRVAQDVTTVSGLTCNALNADLLPSTDIGQYGYATITVTGGWTGGQLGIQFCDSNVSADFQDYSCAYNSGGAASPNIQSNGQYVLKGFGGRYMRIRMEIYGSGICNAVITFYTGTSAVLGDQYVSVGQSSSPWMVSTGQVQTYGGAGNFHMIAAAGTNLTNIKNSQGQIYGYEFYNTASTVRYVKLFNKSIAPTLGTDAPFRTIGVPSNDRVNATLPNGLLMGAGISIATTKGIGDMDATGVNANDLTIDLDYN